MVDIADILGKLLQYWQADSIRITAGKAEHEIHRVENFFGVSLPQEFFQYFNRVNGMEALYPNNADSNGFLFYPLEELTFYEDEFSNYSLSQLNSKLVGKKCLIFADYLQKCWWYALLKDKALDGYSIIRISDHVSYTVIAFSLSDFLKLYMEDADSLY